MARTKVVKTELEEKNAQGHKELGDFVYYYYTTYKNGKPDATVYKNAYKLLEPLFKTDDPNVRVYTCEEMKKVVDFLVASDIALTSFSIFHWPDLVRSIVDDDKQGTRYVIERLKGSQRSQGFYGMKTLDANPPVGW